MVPVPLHNQLPPGRKRPPPISSITITSFQDTHKESPLHTAQRLVANLQNALSREHRHDALQELQNVISVDPERVSVYLLEEGIIAALLLQLQVLLQQKLQQLLPLVVHLLDVTLRQCPQHLRERILLDLNSQALDLLSSELLMVGRKDVATLSISLQHSVLSVLHTLSGSTEGALQILQSRTTLIRAVAVLQSQYTTEDCLVEVLGFWKNVTYFAHQQRLVVVQLPQFLVALASLTTQTNESLLERVSAVLRNLALSTECRRPLVQAAPLTALTRLLQCGRLHYPVVLRNALVTVNSLALDREICASIISFGEGSVPASLQQVLVATSQQHQSLRKKAARAFRLLSHRADLLVRNEDGLVNLLAFLALNDPQEEVRMETTEAFARCAASTPYKSVECLLPHLSQLIRADRLPVSSNEALMRAIKAQVSFSVENRLALLQKTDLLQWILQMAESGRDCIRDDACYTLMKLSSDHASHLLHYSCSRLYAVLETNAHMPYTERQQHTIQTLVHLTRVPEHRVPMLQHHGGRLLLHVLLPYASLVQDPVEKQDVKQAICWLVQAV